MKFLSTDFFRCIKSRIIGYQNNAVVYNYEVIISVELIQIFLIDLTDQ